MFRMYGNIVELYRYKIGYKSTEIKLTENGESTEQIVSREDFCISEEHKNEFIENLGGAEYTVTEIDQTENEWINGLDFDSYEQALECLNTKVIPLTPEQKVQQQIDEMSIAMAAILGGAQ